MGRSPNTSTRRQQVNRLFFRLFKRLRFVLVMYGGKLLFLVFQHLLDFAALDENAGFLDRSLIESQ
jgi:hypothetical protein